MITAYRCILILLLSPERQCVDAFQPLNIHSSWTVRPITSLSTDLQNVCDQHQANGHPALLKAIADFPQTLLNDNPEDVTLIDARRIFHGRGGLYDGANHLTLDYYPPVLLLTSFEELKDVELSIYGEALDYIWKSLVKKETNDDDDVHVMPLTWVYQCRAERGNSTTKLMNGVIPAPHIVTENSGRNKYYVHLLKGQNHGLFLDMSSGRQWLQEKCADEEITSVINLFAYTCAFSVAALNGGSEKVVNIDMSRGALRIGQRNHDFVSRNRGTTCMCVKILCMKPRNQ